MNPLFDTDSPDYDRPETGHWTVEKTFVTVKHGGHSYEVNVAQDLAHVVDDLFEMISEEHDHGLTMPFEKAIELADTLAIRAISKDPR